MLRGEFKWGSKFEFDFSSHFRHLQLKQAEEREIFYLKSPEGKNIARCKAKGTDSQVDTQINFLYM